MPSKKEELIVKWVDNVTDNMDGLSLDDSGSSSKGYYSTSYAGSDSYVTVKASRPRGSKQSRTKSTQSSASTRSVKSIKSKSSAASTRSSASTASRTGSRRSRTSSGSHSQTPGNYYVSMEELGGQAFTVNGQSSPAVSVTSFQPPQVAPHRQALSNEAHVDVMAAAAAAAADYDTSSISSYGTVSTSKNTTSSRLSRKLAAGGGGMTRDGRLIKQDSEAYDPPAGMMVHYTTYF